MDHSDEWMTGISPYSHAERPKVDRALEKCSNKVFNCLRVYGTTIKALHLDNNKISSIEDTMTIVGVKEDVAKTQ